VGIDVPVVRRMSGQLWALVAGVGFGIFQSSNRRAVAHLDVYVSTFLQLLISGVVMAAISLAAGDWSLLRGARLSAVVNFGAAGLFHFFVGWTLLNASQKRIGAARTSPFTGTVPLFATFIAAFTLREVPHLLALAGVAIVVAGVFIVSLEKGDAQTRIGWRGAMIGLSAALCWSISPIFIRWGLAELPSPLLGLTIGIVTAVAAYAVLMLFGLGARGDPINVDAMVFKIIAGLLVGLSQWARWTALGLAPVGVVLALTQVSTPVTILVSPLLVGRHIEHVTARVWLGAAVIIMGSLVLVLLG
jgi:drug/metabolite transporter (DMT)-like permease